MRIPMYTEETEQDELETRSSNPCQHPAVLPPLHLSHTLKVLEMSASV